MQLIGENPINYIRFISYLSHYRFKNEELGLKDDEHSFFYIILAFHLYLLFLKRKTKIKGEHDLTFMALFCLIYVQIKLFVAK